MKKEFVGKEALERLISLIKTNKQDKTDKGLKTKDKTIVGAINEVNDKAGQGGGLTEEQVKAVVRETAVTQETDPTVPAWAKQAKKPTYSYEEIKDKPDLFSGNYNDLSNKPDLFSGNYNDLSNKPTIPSTEGLATVKQLENLTDKTDELEEYSIREVSLGILEDNELSVKLKDKEGNVIASAETTLPMPDLTDYVKNTDYATKDKYGVIKASLNGGFNLYSGDLYIAGADKSRIDAKTSHYNPIVPSRLDYAVKVGVTTNTETLTDDEKASACDWLGAMPIVKPSAAYISYVITIGKDESGKIEYNLTSLGDFLQRSNTGVDTGKIPMYTGNIIDKSEEYANMNATLYVATPKGKKHAANKEYVDNLVGDIESVLTAILGV